MAILDCFLYRDESELLEVRLIELDGIVDYHILVESTHTFQGRKKPLYFQREAKRFAPWKERIVHVVLDTAPAPNPWLQEAEQREGLDIGLELIRAKPDDLLLLSDADEIPDRFAIGTAQLVLSPEQPIVTFHQRLYRYYLNARDGDWLGTRGCYVRDLPASFQVLRDHAGGALLADGGWHFTSMGGRQRIARKLRAFSHKGPHDAMLRRVTADLAKDDPTAGLTIEPLDARFPIALTSQPERWRDWLHA